MTLDFFQNLKEHRQLRPQHAALQILSDGHRESFTYERIVNEVTRIGTYLQSRGIGPGRTVGIVMENHPRWGIAFLAVQSSGARIVPFDVMHSPETLARLIEHAECTFLISSQPMLEKLEEVQGLLPEPLPALISEGNGQNYPSWEKILEDTEAADGLPLVTSDPDEVFLLVYTSGTTGNPKGVMLTQRNIYRTVVEVLQAVELSAEDHILSVLPLYHMLALMTNFLIPLYEGARVTYLDVLEPQRILKTFREEGITLFVCVPQFFYLIHRRIFQEVEKQSLLKRMLFSRLLAVSRFCNIRLGWNPGPLFFGAVHKNFGALRLFGVGGARFDREVAASFRDLGFNLAQAYGMTETSAISTVAQAGTKAMASVGRPLSHVEIRIDEPDEHEVGEILIRGEHVMKGYWKNEEATSETLRDGWLHSGDLGHLDSEGYVYITGRKKDVIVLSSGKNIYPEEIEQAYEKQSPFIKEMCVLGVADTSSSQEQEKLHAVIVPDFDYLKSQQVVNAYEMIRYRLETISQQFPPYKRVRSFEIRRDPLPRTTTRKIKRFEVEQQLQANSGADASAPAREQIAPQSPTEEKLFHLLRQTGKTTVVHKDMSLELDCGFDSLERVEFLSNVQDTFKIQISDEAATEIYTVGELVEAVDKRLSGEIREEETESRVSWAAILNAPLDDDDRKEVHRILRRRPLIEVIYFAGSRVVRLLFKILFRLNVEGAHNLPRQYPFMLCPNHLSFVDAFVVGAGLPLRIIRRLFYLGYADYFGSSGMSLVSSLIKVIPVDSDRHLRQALRLGAQGLRENLVLCVFPEGERSIDGKLKTFRKGPSILAVELGVPVVPVAVIGTFEVWARGSSKIKLGKVSVRYGQPLAPLPEETYDAFNERLFEAVQRLIQQQPTNTPLAQARAS